MENMEAWKGIAQAAAEKAARRAAASRKRWDGQAAWDAENMRTVSTRFRTDQADRLREYCREANVTRYGLINYMLRAWMAAWERTREVR